MKQLQAINDLFLNSKEDDNIPLEFFFASKVAPRWVLRKELCDSYIKLGLAKAALDEFLGIKKVKIFIESQNFQNKNQKFLVKKKS